MSLPQKNTLFLDTIAPTHPEVIARIVDGVPSLSAVQLAEPLRHLADRAVEASINGIVIADATLPDTPLIYVNPAFERMTGYTASEVIGRNCRFLQAHERDQVAIMNLRRALVAGESCTVVLRNYRKDGSLFWNELFIAPVHNEQGQVVAFIGVQNDITARKTLEQREAEERFHALVQHASDIIMIVADDGTISYASPAVEQVLAFDIQQFVGKRLVELDLLHPDDLGTLRTVMQAVIRQPDQPLDMQLRAIHRDGTWRELHVIVANLMNDPAVRGLVVTARDLTERNRVEAQLRHQALHDALTGLPNRTLFIDRLHHAVLNLNRTKQTHAVLLLDLDRFKVINESLGHSAGDSLLLAVSQRLESCLRITDTLARIGDTAHDRATISRLGGDEFAVLLEHVSNAIDVARIADRLIMCLSDPFMVADREVYVTTSIGIVVTTPAYDHPEEVLRDVDVALYRAKQQGKARSVIFDDTMNRLATEQLGLESDLRRALARDEFRVYYQPIIALADGSVSGVEALVRWQHPVRALIPPIDFIPLAEETGLILPIGTWVLRTACQQVQAWQPRDSHTPPLQLSVNLSARQFQDPNLIAEISDVLRESGLAADRLKLEITESVVMEDVATTGIKLAALKELGVKLAIDDFGTGYSSLSYLKRFPVDTLKIDRAFVGEIVENIEDRAIVQAIITLAHTLGLNVTAEGIETVDVNAYLKAQGCETGQGYYFARPLPEAELTTLLNEQGWVLT